MSLILDKDDAFRNHRVLHDCCTKLLQYSNILISQKQLSDLDLIFIERDMKEYKCFDI